jgi:hypothetical protein
MRLRPGEYLLHDVVDLRRRLRDRFVDRHRTSPASAAMMAATSRERSYNRHW